MLTFGCYGVTLDQADIAFLEYMLRAASFALLRVLAESLVRSL